MAGVPLYAPPAFFIWWFRFGAHVPKIFAAGVVIAASGGVAVVVTADAMSLVRAKETKEITTYGSARRVTHQEMRAAGLLQPDGVVLGRVGLLEDCEVLERVLRDLAPEPKPS